MGGRYDNYGYEVITMDDDGRLFGRALVSATPTEVFDQLPPAFSPGCSEFFEFYWYPSS